MKISNNKQVLVTGGAGFIGSHLCKRLLKEGLTPVILDNLTTGKKENIYSGCKFIQGDILDYQIVKRSIKEVTAIFHLAANVTIRGSVDKFYEDAQTNIMGTLNLLRACKESKKIGKFIFSSSMAVYADSSEPKPIKEDYPTNPLSPYGISKLASERFIQMACKSIGIQSLVLRYFNTYGPKQTFTPYVGVITIFINQLLKNKPLTIFGDGQQKRDFVYVGDIVEATWKAYTTNRESDIWNVGTGKPTSVNQIAELLMRKMESNAKIKYLPVRPEELRNSIADSGRLLKYTGFIPKFQLEDKIDEVIDYINNKSHISK